MRHPLVLFTHAHVDHMAGVVHHCATRDMQGKLRALYNRCTHRGARVCRQERGNARTFQCAYHGWTYFNTGKLLNDEAGYKVIIVLTGMHESLRCQTQIRIDEGFLGRKSQPRGAGPQAPGRQARCPGCWRR